MDALASPSAGITSAITSANITSNPSGPNPGLIYTAMIKVMRNTDAIAKDSKNQAQGFQFRGIDAVLNALHPVFARHGVFILPRVISREHVERPTKSGGTSLHHFTKVNFRFVAEDGSWVEAETVGEAADSGDKGANKTMSMALKYALFQILLIPTEEQDADGETHEFQPRSSREASAPQQRRADRQEPSAPAAAAAHAPTGPSLQQAQSGMRAALKQHGITDIELDEFFAVKNWIRAGAAWTSLDAEKTAKATAWLGKNAEMVLAWIVETKAPEKVGKGSQLQGMYVY